MQEITHNNELIAKIIRPDDWSKGLTFFSDNDQFVQVGTWWYDKGHKLANHYHLDYERTATRTQECVYVVSGSMNMKFFSITQEFLCEHVLDQGELCIILAGGHGYEILQDDTKIIETKNGPFFSVDKDKVKF
jgi:hypothetical protein